MKSYIKGGLISCVIVILSLYAWNDTKAEVPLERKLQVTSYQTNSVRTENVIKYCADTTRSSLTNSASLAQAQKIQKNTEAQLGVDGNKLFFKLAKGNLGDVISMLTGKINLYIFVGIFVLGLIIFLFSWPFLCCCCCCPSCCPSKCCQKPENEAYSKCELYWPAVTLILALTFTISVSVYGFVHTTDIKTTFTGFQCSISIFTDDILNGNLTDSGTQFFAGLSALSSSITTIDTNLVNLKNQMADLGQNTTAASIGLSTKNNIDAVTTVQTNEIAALDTGFNPVYNTPVTSSPTSGTFTSTFKAKLGDQSTSTTYAYKVNQAFTEVILNMTLIKQFAANFGNAAGVNSGSLTSMRTTVNDLITNINDMDKNMKTFLGYLSMPKSYGNIGLQGFYGFMILFSTFALIGALLTVCCNKYGCRHLMYFSCMFIFLATLITFFIAFLFSILFPIFTWMCSYLDYSLLSQVNFKSNFESFLNADSSDKLATCMPFGTGLIISKVGGTASDGLNNLTSVISNLFSFNQTYLQGLITSNMTVLSTQTNNYADGKISDLDSTNNQYLIGLSDPSNSTNSANCGSSFALDSWVPSNSQDTSDSNYINCKVSTGKVGDATTCTSATFNDAAGQDCQGCMDTTKVLSGFTSKANVETAARNKYTPTCVFATTLANTWQNYYSIKKTHFDALKTRITAASNKINTGSNQVRNALTGYRSSLNTLNSSLSGISAVTHPQYGVLAGMNCKVFGEDFVRLKNVICGGFYKNIYQIRLVFGMTAFGMLFSMCCIVCTGVRHFKKSERQGKVLDIDLNPKFESSGQHFQNNMRR